MNKNKYSICFFDFKRIYKVKDLYSCKKEAVLKANELLNNQSLSIIDFIGGTICIVNNNKRVVVWSRQI